MKYAHQAVRHVRAGGHAVVWETDARAWMVVPQPDPANVSDLGYWSILDLGRQRYRIAKVGPFRGLAVARIPRGNEWIGRRRAERDSIWPGPMRSVRFDCLTCGACCRSNEVILEREDVNRFKKSGRDDLLKRPLVRKGANGKITLALLRNKDCRHMGSDNRCGIYEIRPNACRHFPVGSECCLFAREEELGVHDGVVGGEHPLKRE